MKKNEEDCTCTDECLGYLTMNCKEIETLEEGFDRIFDSIDYIEFDYASFEQGAKWNQEQIYNEIKELYDNENITGFSKLAYAKCLDIIKKK